MPLAPRVDRLERLLRLSIKAGIKMRKNLAELDDKFRMITNIQMEHMEVFLRNELKSEEYEKRFALNEERFARNEERLMRLAAHTDKKFEEVAQAQARTDQQIARVAEQQLVTDRKLAELIEVVRAGH